MAKTKGKTIKLFYKLIRLCKLYLILSTTSHKHVHYSVASNFASLRTLVQENSN